jgi:hypothetical protein
MGLTCVGLLAMREVEEEVKVAVKTIIEIL